MTNSDISRRLLISYQPTESGRNFCVVVYDITLNKIDDLTLYAHWLHNNAMLSEKTVLQAVYTVRLAKEYFIQLSGENTRSANSELPLDYFSISDETLRRYRDCRLTETRERTKQTSEQTAKRTVNASMRCVYDWLWWLRKSGRTDDYLIGSFPCRVISEIKSGKGIFGAPFTMATHREKHSTPLCFARVGGRVGHKPPGFVPSEKARLDLLQHFSLPDGRSNYLKERNKLFLNIVNHLGMRRDSVNSLNVSQFKRADIDLVLDREEYYSVQPKRQKNSYDDWYDFPIWLAYQVTDFIEQFRSAEMVKRSWTEREAKGAIFLSARNGRPIENGSLTKLFSNAMRVIGAPKRAAIHAWRHKNVGESIDEEIAYRLDRGLDTSAASICEAVSAEKGHKNPASLNAYVVSQLSKRRKKNR